MSFTVDLLANPLAHRPSEIIKVILMYLAINIVWSLWLWQGTKKLAYFTPPYFLAYLLALPCLLLYLSPMLTLLTDVIAHHFSFAERFILVFCLVVATNMLGVLYAVAIRYPRNGQALGLLDGMALSLWMWLLSLPVGVCLIWLDSQFKIFAL